MFAALNGHREAVKTLLQHEADPNLLAAGDSPPLFCALQAGDEFCTSLLTDVTNTGNILIIVTFT